MAKKGINKPRDVGSVSNYSKIKDEYLLRISKMKVALTASIARVFKHE